MAILKKEVESLPIQKEFCLQMHFPPLLTRGTHHLHRTARTINPIRPSGHAWGLDGNLGAHENISNYFKIRKKKYIHWKCTNPA